VLPVDEAERAVAVAVGGNGSSMHACSLCRFSMTRPGGGANSSVRIANCREAILEMAILYKRRCLSPGVAVKPAACERPSGDISYRQLYSACVTSASSMAQLKLM